MLRILVSVATYLEFWILLLLFSIHIDRAVTGSNLVSYGQLDDQGFGLAVSETSPRFHKITTPQGDTFHAYKTKISNVYQIGERVKIGNTNQKSPAYSTPAIRHTPGSPPIRGEASNNKITNITTGRDRGRPIWSIQGPTGNRLPKRKKDNRVSLRGRWFFWHMSYWETCI